MMGLTRIDVTQLDLPEKFDPPDRLDPSESYVYQQFADIVLNLEQSELNKADSD